MSTTPPTDPKAVLYECPDEDCFELFGTLRNFSKHANESHDEDDWESWGIEDIDPKEWAEMSLPETADD